MQALRVASFRKNLTVAAKRLAVINNLDKVFLVSFGYGYFLVAAYHEQDALDILVNENMVDNYMMDENDYLEYRENGWDDSYMLLGNASEPFWCENLYIEQVF